MKANNMSTHVNTDMSDFWNGPGGEKWIRFQARMDLFLTAFGDKAVEIAAIQAGDHILEIGCGCGDTSIELARRTGARGRIHGLDISAPIIAEAVTKTKNLKMKSLSFECGDAQVLAFEPSAYDLIYSRFGIMFFDNPVAAFYNMRSALKPGGRTAFACWQPALDNQWVTLALEITSRHVPLPAPSGSEDPGPFSFGNPERIKHVLTGAGFSAIDITPVKIAAAIGQNPQDAASFLTQLGPAASAINQAEADATTIAAITSDIRSALKAFEGEGGVMLEAAAWVVTAHNP